MTKIVAALDNGLAARPVVATATALGQLLAAELEPVHVKEDGEDVARSAVEAVGLPLRQLRGSVVDELVRVGGEEDVAAVVIGARGTPGGSRPLGGTALAVASQLAKPLVIVPPDGRVASEIRSVLVPLEEAISPSLVPRAILAITADRSLDVSVLHVHDEASLPAFTDQPQHEHEAWMLEFLRRYCPWGIGRAELLVRVGKTSELVPDLAAELGSDLIALGWAQELAPGRAPVVRATLERARVPVMLIPVRVDVVAAAA